MKQPVTGVQLYTLRNHTKTAEDFAATLKWIASNNVHDVQISAIGPDITPLQQKEALERNQMRVCVTHQNFERLSKDLDVVIEGHKIIGCDSVGLGYAPDERRKNEADARDFVQTLCGIADQLNENGLSFHYHNHAFEFEPLPDSEVSLMDLMLETDPAKIKLIADVAWIRFAGHDPAEFLKKNAERIKVVHFKDYVRAEDGSANFVSLGQGVVDLKACWDVCCEKEIPFIMYEQDSGWTNGDPFLATQEALDFFKTLHI